MRAKKQNPAERRKVSELSLLLANEHPQNKKPWLDKEQNQSQKLKKSSFDRKTIKREYVEKLKLRRNQGAN